MRNLWPGVTVAVVLAALAGCGSSSPKTSKPTISADQRLAAQISARAAERRRQARRVAAQLEAAGKSPRAEEEAPSGEAGNGGQASPSGAEGPLLTESDRAGFVALAQRLGGSSGVAVRSVGGGGSTSSSGELASGVAWSTIKTAIAAATFAGGTVSPATSSRLARAITASDNAAAEQLWEALGPPAQAGERVTAQLRDGGDTRTRVQTQKVRSGFSAFGQTEWTLADQVRFTASLPCTAPGKKVTALMRQVRSDQRWGLGSAGVPVAFKGGWGPEPSGAYLVRQMGILTIKGHPIAVAVATRPGDGAFATGTANLTKLSAWLVTHVNYRRAPSELTC